MANANRQFGGYSNVALGKGAVGGIVAYLIGFFLIFVMKTGTIGDRMGSVVGQLSGTGVAPPETFQIVGWIYYAAHFVGSSVNAVGRTQEIPITSSGSALWEGWFYLIPIVVLVVVGYLVASLAVSHDGYHGFQAGASVAAGYLPLAAIGAVVVTWGGSVQGVSFSAGPSLVIATIVAGLVYPVVFGGLGGLIAGSN